MSARLVALGDDDVDACFDMAPSVLDCTGEGGNLDALFSTHVDHPLGRWAERARDQADVMLEDDLDDVFLFFVAHRKLFVQLSVGWKRRDGMLFEQFV